MRKIGDRVPGAGPLNARIIAIGEAPGRQEDHDGRPFVGGSGNLMKKWWLEAGINRYRVRIENMHEFRPPSYNNIESVPVEVLYKSIKDMHQRIADLKDPHVIVPTGNYPTFALTGKGKVKAALRKMFGEDLTLTEAEKKAGITVLRGSTYIYTDLRGREIKVIPTIHPAAVMRTQKWEKRVKRDWRVVEEESHTRGYKPPKRTHIAKPIQFELDHFIDQVSAATQDDRMAIDIETWGNTLSCVGFALSPYYSITLPLVTKDEKEFYWPYVHYLCNCPVPKVLQNGLFDWYWLDAYGVNLYNYVYDTMAMHHCIDPVESHDLAFLASYFTRQNYWKDEAKDAEEIKKYANNMSALWEYNGLDCCLTRELCGILEQKLDEGGLRKFYTKHYTEMFEPLLRVMRYGVKVNVKEQKKWAKRLVEEATVLREELAGVAGEDLWAKKAFSKVKLHRFLYKTLKCPRQKKTYFRKEGKVRDDSVDEVALKRLTLRYPKKIGDSGLKILKVRSLLKKASVLKKGWDKDGRIRTTYKLTTEQGRLSSSKNPMGRGYNLQNIEREKGGIRKTFLPDDGCIFVRVDLSQSEDRFCKMYTRDPDMVEQANLRPHEWDSHTENARIIFRTDSVTGELRHLGKTAVHACVDEKTEILTNKGFIPFTTLTKKMKVAQWSPENSYIKFKRPWRIYSYKFDGELLRFLSKGTDILVTPNHRIGYYTRWKNNFLIKEAKDLKSLCSVKVPVCGHYHRGSLTFEECFLRLIVAAQADARIVDKYCTWKLKRKNKIQRLVKLLEILSIKYNRRLVSDDSTVISISVEASKNILRWLDGKSFSEELINMCPRSMKIFMDEIPRWDGSTQSRRSWIYFSTNLKSLDIVQSIATLSGYRTQLKKANNIPNENQKQLYRLYLSKVHGRSTKFVGYESYKGKVYCVGTETGFFIIRRNGKVSVTGNSQRFMKGSTLADNLLKMDIVKTPRECQKMIDTYLAGVPAIERNYFPFVKRNIIAGGVLGNSWGRMIDYSAMFISQELFRKGASFYLQSENADLLNMLGFKFIFNYIKDRGLKSRLVLNVHDECVLSCPREEAYEITSVLVKSLETPRKIMGNWISIPACPQVGMSWDKGDCFEWNYLPEREEFEMKVEEVLC